MLKYIIILITISISVFGLVSFTEKTTQPDFDVNLETPVWDIYDKIGISLQNVVDEDMTEASVEKGYELVHQGYTTNSKNKKTKRISKHFTCTACHNIQPEYKDLSNKTPENKLAYAIENNIPYLQGSSFYGIVNRLTFYNDDYQKKYAHVENIKPAYSDLRTAIEVCAVECSKGRSLEIWETESILAYLWTLQLRLKDLTISDQELMTIQKVVKNRKNTSKAYAILNSKFSTFEEANFTEPKQYKTLPTSESKDPKRIKNGEHIYKLACQHCHEGKRYSMFNLDDSRHSHKYLFRQTRKGKRNSVYKISRYGTSPKNLKKAYMPGYTLEKMSDEQVEDLRIFLQHAVK